MNFGSQIFRIKFLSDLRQLSVQKTVFLCINLRKKNKTAQLMGLKLNRLAI